jgi:DNA mismatch repair ATPase MutL
LFSGFFGSEGSSGKEKQFIFVNRRFVRSSKLNKSVRDAFKGSIVLTSSVRHQTDFKPKPNTAESPSKSSVKLQPVFCLFLQVPPSQFDLTFHPRKTEIEFRYWDLVNHKNYLKTSSKFSYN